MSTFRDRIHKLHKELVSTQNLELRISLIQANSDVFHTNCTSRKEDCQAGTLDHWGDLHDAGIFVLLIDWISVPYAPTVTVARFIFWVVRALHGVLTHYNPILNETHQKDLLKNIPIIFESQNKTVLRLNDTRPRLADAYLVMSEAIISFLASIQNLFDGIDDTKICNLIDQNALMEIIFACLLTPEPHGIHVADSSSFVLTRCMYLVPKCKNVRRTTVERVWAIYGSEAISAECARLLMLCPTEITTISGVDSLIMILQRAATQSRNWELWRGEVHQSVVRGFWLSLRKSDVHDDGFVRRHAYRLMSLLRLSLTFFEEMKQRPRIICDLIGELLRNEDAILFFGKLLSVMPYTEDYVEEIEQTLGQWGDWIVLECQADRSNDLLDTHCRPAWSQVYRRLTQRIVQERSAKVAHEEWHRSAAARDIWATFGQRMKIPEAVPPGRHESSMMKLDERKQCDWFKCPLHLQSVDGSYTWEMLRCSQCRKVQYCGQPCQKRHWEFRHELECIQTQT